MLETIFWPLVIFFPVLVGFWQWNNIAKFFRPITCPQCQHTFPVPTRSMPPEEAQQLVGKYGYRCPKCPCESDYRGIPLTAGSPTAVQYELKWIWAAMVLLCVLPLLTIVMCQLLLPRTVKAADEIQELAQALVPRFAPTATDINNALDEVRAKLVLYEHRVQHGPGVYSLGIEFENLSISHYARIEFNALDPKLELLDEANKLVPQLPAVRTGPVPANQIAIVPPGSFVTFSTIYPGSGMHGATGQLTSGNHTWRVAVGRYRVRGTVPAKVSLVKGEFQEERPPSRYLPPREWPKDAGQIELKLPLAEFSVPMKALP
jgi:hypothetical protein